MKLTSSSRLRLIYRLLRLGMSAWIYITLSFTFKSRLDSMFKEWTYDNLLTFLYLEKRWAFLSSSKIVYSLLLLKSTVWIFNLEKSYLVFWLVLAKSRMDWYVSSSDVRPLLLIFRFIGPPLAYLPWLFDFSISLPPSVVEANLASWILPYELPSITEFLFSFDFLYLLDFDLSAEFIVELLLGKVIPYADPGLSVCS